MNSFYETELPEIGEYTELTSKSVDPKNTSQINNLKEYNRRDIKQDPKQKAKDKLWESIVSAAEASDDSEEEEGKI